MVRAWALRLAGDARHLASPVLKAARRLAEVEPNAEVRAQVLSTARRLPADQALPFLPCRGIEKVSCGCDDEGKLFLFTGVGVPWRSK